MGSGTLNGSSRLARDGGINRGIQPSSAAEPPNALGLSRSRRLSIPSSGSLEWRQSESRFQSPRAW
jgi:hypothetical protein